MTRRYHPAWKMSSSLSICVLAVLASQPAAAGEADRFSDVQITSQHVRGSVHMLTGAGGNIGLSVGNDGTLLIDNQFLPLAERIQEVLNKTGGDSPKLVLNTHFHGDHAGGNAFFGGAGTIIAHENVRIRLFNQADVDRVSLPLVTYLDRIRIFFNDDEIEVIHMPAGHTDGDSVVWFKVANVIHMGDHLFTGRFPFIDVQSGGSVEGYANNLEAILQWVPDDIVVIPGHGEITNVAGIAESLQMIRETHGAVKAAVAAGTAPADIIAAGVAEQWAAFGSGFINEARWIQILLADPTSASQ